MMKFDRERCFGCGACAARCARQCISMQKDGDGFYYPVTDKARCSACGLCNQLCPLNQWAGTAWRAPRRVLAAWSKDRDIVRGSSSGGIFSELALRVLRDGGVVFGAATQEVLRVKHIGVTSEDDLWRLRGSKYMQSDTAEAYAEAERFLKLGRRVLFSGTACQLLGLARCLGGEDNRLITCGIVCHGVPPPGLFADHVTALQRRWGLQITGVEFREKSKGWRSPRIVYRSGGRTLSSMQLYNDEFMHAFRENKILRSCCYTADCRAGGPAGDLTLGDFWGCGCVPPSATRRGISAVMVGTQRGEELLRSAADRIVFVERSLEEAAAHNKAILTPARKHPDRDALFRDYKAHGYRYVQKRYLRLSPADKLLRRLKAEYNSRTSGRQSKG